VGAEEVEAAEIEVSGVVAAAEAEGETSIWDVIPQKHGKNCHQKIKSELLKEKKNLHSSNPRIKGEAVAPQDKCRL
jgi:hypothetical protein